MEGEESDDEDGETLPITTDPEEIVSPTDLCVSRSSALQVFADRDDRSRRLVEEEGEVFRKGAVLLTSEDMEGEYDSEELRKEVRSYELSNLW